MGCTLCVLRVHVRPSHVSLTDFVGCTWNGDSIRRARSPLLHGLDSVQPKWGPTLLEPPPPPSQTVTAPRHCLAPSPRHDAKNARGICARNFVRSSEEMLSIEVTVGEMFRR